ncbi:MAG: cytochrome P460 family protein [Desulfobacteraceae bacterium]|nr:cytochrome P460 family protein [Desulfobacteraceae bacterium]
MKQTAQPFGSEVDIAYSHKLWKALEKAKLVGHDRIRALPYKGTHPHGVILEQLSTMIKIHDLTGIVYIKSNYMAEKITKSKVVNDPESCLMSIAVMFKREPGYDSENQDWFWAKYKPDGTLLTNPKGMALAGRIGKGMDMGCIACHKSAQGDDFLFNNTAKHLD